MAIQLPNMLYLFKILGCRSPLPDMELAGRGALMGLILRSEELPGRPPCNAFIRFLFSTSNGYPQFKHKRADAAVSWMNKFSKKAHSYARSIREHVRIRGTKPSVGAKIISPPQKRGSERAFRQMFGVREGEKLLMALQCHLSTTAGPVAGTLFVSTEKIAFQSDRPFGATSPTGEVIRIPYKVMIPLKKIRKAGQSENVSKPSSQTYIKITTVDDYDFWFMGVC